MKLSLVALTALAASAVAAPSAMQARNVAVMDHPEALKGDAHGVDALDAAFGYHTLVARDLDAGECRNACETTAKFKAFCKLIPNPIARAACWVTLAALGTDTGEDICTNWCDATF